jgi:hypothetical protein
VSDPVDPNASPEMQSICSTDSPLPQPIPSIDVAEDAIVSAVIAFAKKAEQWATSGDSAGAAALLDSASRAYSAIS